MDKELVIKHTKIGTFEQVINKMKEPGVNMEDLKEYILSEQLKLGFNRSNKTFIKI